MPRSRLAGWLDRFAARHGDPEVRATEDAVLLRSPDGAEAGIRVPFLPWTPAPDPLPALLRHVAVDRTLGVVLARRGGHAAGVVTGEQLLASKVGSGYVQGRTKAGGWSQQRYARRRANQAARAGAEAVEDAARVLLPWADRLQHLVLGGDRRVVEDVLADPRLEPLSGVPREPDVRPTPDPRLVVLQELDPTSVAVTLNELA
ncbi:hypothetical protein GC722_11250 [Auraticoccus sp. F435]|uniref:Actinobacteria/chloroflexi VLRF1 release factor domain-containing protein n=1 Tax=Auraticoccus cholistanensis TaxID=2656650 RepID=A0A6A9UXV0_9ACTN|nr:hypothetical protein [Auraticoccus cholistanensis]